MALTLDELNSITDNLWTRDAFDNFFVGNVLLMRLLKNGPKKNGGKTIRIPLWNAQTNGGSYDGTDTFDISEKEVHTAADFLWKHYYENVSVKVTDELQNSGEAEMVDLVMSKLDNAQMSIRDRLGVGLYTDGTGNSSKDVTGLLAMMNTTTATRYGDIAEDDMATWTGIHDSTSEVLTLAVMRAFRTSLTVADRMPTIYTCPLAIFDVYIALLATNQRFTDPNLASAGFTAVEFEGKPVVADQKATSATMFGIHEPSIEFTSHTEDFFKNSGWKVPTNQNTKIMQITWSGNLTCRERRVNGRHSGLS